MRIIISPAKKMNQDLDTLEVLGIPVYLERTQILLDKLRTLSYSELKKLWLCNDSIASLNMERLQKMDLKKLLTPAILSYEGLQYQYMAPNVLSFTAYEYLEEHLRILSGFYGILKPFDGVRPYRLEMQARLPVDGAKNLYEFWGNSLYKELMSNDRTIVNLASLEYAKVIEPHLQKRDRWVNVVFGEYKDGKIIQKATQAKMARGKMVRFMAERNIQSVEEMKEFSDFSFVFSQKESTENTLVFIKGGV